MEAIETFKKNGYTVRIYQDDDVTDPRVDMDHLGVMVCFHQRYTLGDRGHGFREDEYTSWSAVKDAIDAENDPAIALPLRLFDHSGISMSVGSGAHQCDPGGWDSGQVGWIFMTKKVARENFGKRLTKAVLAKIEACLEAEVEEYDQYLTGDVYWYEVEDANGDTVDSCGGLYGFKWAKEAAEEAVPEDPSCPEEEIAELTLP
jgi:hypothetical protein